MSGHYERDPWNGELEGGLELEEELELEGELEEERGGRGAGFRGGFRARPPAFRKPFAGGRFRRPGRPGRPRPWIFGWGGGYGYPYIERVAPVVAEPPAAAPFPEPAGGAPPAAVEEPVAPPEEGAEEWEHLEQEAQYPELDTKLAWRVATLSSGSLTVAASGAGAL